MELFCSWGLCVGAFIKLTVLGMLVDNQDLMHLLERFLRFFVRRSFA